MANFFKQLFVGSQFTSSPSRQSQDYYQAVLEQAIDAVVSIDSHNKVTFFNAAAEALWGYQRHEVIVARM